MYSNRAAKLRFFFHILCIGANKIADLILIAAKSRYVGMKRKRCKPVEAIPEIEGYVVEKKTISMLKANIVALLAMALLALLGLMAMYAIWGAFPFGRPWTGAAFFPAVVLGIVVHELIHGFTWMWVTRSGFRHLRFGTLSGGVYCHIDVPMNKRKYVIGALMPLLLLGVLPFLLSFVMPSLWMMLFGVLFISAAMGDVMIVWVIRHEPADTLVYDHPTEAGCMVYHKQ